MIGFKQVRACVVGELIEIQDMEKKEAGFCRNGRIKGAKLPASEVYSRFVLTAPF